MKETAGDRSFRFITPQEPPKAEAIAYLETPTEALRASRTARVQIIVSGDDKTNALEELIVDLDKSAITKRIPLKGRHPYIDAQYMQAVEKACFAHQQGQDEINKLDLPPGSTVCVEPWAYATDGMNNMTQLVSMVCTLSATSQSLV